jgi:hypothetical protein
MGVHVRCTSAKKLVSSIFAKILKVATKIRETCEKTLFTPPIPTKATNSIVSVQAIRGCQNCQHMFSNRLLQHRQQVFSDTTYPNHKRLFSNFLSPNCHRLFSNKRAQNCQIYLAIISSRLPVVISNIRMPNG